MPSEVSFKNQQEIIKNEIGLAFFSIKIAMAYFTDKELFSLICEKQRQGIDVQLVLDCNERNQNSGIDYNILASAGGLIRTTLRNKKDKSIMHHKFCIIDCDTVIHGSYNWTNNAKQNNENITIVRDEQEVVDSYDAEFIKLLEEYPDNHLKGYPANNERIDTPVHPWDGYVQEIRIKERTVSNTPSYQYNEGSHPNLTYSPRGDLLDKLLGIPENIFLGILLLPVFIFRYTFPIFMFFFFVFMAFLFTYIHSEWMQIALKDIIK